METNRSQLGSPTPQPPQFLYIDGAAVRAAAKFYSPFFGGEADIPIDWKQLGLKFDRVFYYDCLPGQKNGEESSEYDQRVKPLREKYDQMRSVSGFFVNYGVVARRRKTYYEQKRVDTMIAVDILMNAHRRIVDRVTLLTNDQDFYPVVLAAMELGTQVTLLCQPHKTNNEFLYSTDKMVGLSLALYHSWLPKELKEKYPLPKYISSTPGGVWNYKYEGDDYKIYGYAKGWFVKIESVSAYCHQFTDLGQLRSFLPLEYPGNELVDDILGRINNLEKEGA